MSEPRPAATIRPRPADAPQRLARALRAALARAGSSDRAAGMQRYMRSAMPFHGVAQPERARIERSLFAALEFRDRAELEAIVRAVWEGARFREERYAAISLSGLRAARAFQTPELLALYEQLVVEGAWWDYVDEVAIRRIGPILRAYPDRVGPRMRRWSRSTDLWKRRTSIICQIGSGSHIDRPLLQACIEPSLDSREFFLRKAIGWALRQDARIAPEAVRSYVAAHADRLSPLSRREALRRIGPDR